MLGDLNYRIVGPDRATILKLIENQRWGELLESDQLAQQMVCAPPSPFRSVLVAPSLDRRKKKSLSVGLFWWISKVLIPVFC